MTIQVVISAKALDFGGMDLTVELQEGHKVFQIIEAICLWNIENLVYIKPNVQPPALKKSLDFGNVDAQSLRNETEGFQH